MAKKSGFFSGMLEFVYFDSQPSLIFNSLGFVFMDFVVGESLEIYNENSEYHEQEKPDAQT